MPFTRLPFTSLGWTAGAHPLERKKLVDGQSVALLEFAPRFVDPNWCERGHVIYVLDGTLESRARRPDGAASGGVTGA